MAPLREFTPVLSSIIANLPQAVIVTDKNSKIHFANEGAAKMFGYQASELQSLNLERLMPAQFHAQHHKHVKNYVLKEKTVRLMGENLRVSAKRKDSSEFLVEASIAHLNIDGAEPMAMVIMTSLSSQKYNYDNLNNELIESTAASSELLTMLDTIEDFVIIIDKKFNYLYINQAALDFNKKKRSEILGKSFWEIYPSLVGTVVEQEYGLAFETGEKRTFEFLFTPRKKSFRINLIPSSSTLVIHTIDITDMKTIKESNKKMMDTIEEVLGVKLIKKERRKT
jgi:PAS domain S-box-containing protein